MRLPTGAGWITGQPHRSAARPRDHVDASTWAGERAELRPLDRGETGPLLAVFEGMSLASRADRYLVGMPSLPPALLDMLTAVDNHDHVAWLASIARRPVGIARYFRVQPDLAEIALEVVDDYQGRGLGTALLDVITTVACAQGVRRVRVTLLPSNWRSRRLLRRVGIRLTAEDGLLEGEGGLRLLDPPRVNRRAVLALAQAHGVRAQGVTAPLECPCA